MIENQQQPADMQFFELVKEAVKDGIEFVRNLEDQGVYIGKYVDWPQLSYHETGLPYFSRDRFSGPVDYTNAFGIWNDPKIREEEIPSFQAVLAYARSNSRLISYFGSPSENPDGGSLFDRLIYLFIENIIDRYIHVYVYNDEEFSTEKFTTIYLLMERGVFSDELWLEFAVPILFVKFDFDYLAIGGNGIIWKMSEEFQIARKLTQTYTPGVHNPVSDSATHVLILSGWTMPNDNYWTVSNILSSLQSYPLAHIDKFFSALRIVTGIDTGYAQVLALPMGWTHKFTAHVPSIKGQSTRTYPASFEDRYWNVPVPTLTEQQIQETNQMFKNLLENSSSKIIIAAQRLNRCLLRETDEDSILDAAIALEALVGGENQEITHKLALRIAALSRLSDMNDVPAHDIFLGVKGIYSYRSKVIHGNPNPNKAKEITAPNKEPIRAVVVATNYLRMVMKVLIEHPQYLNAHKIDEDLLLGALDSKP